MTLTVAKILSRAKALLKKFFFFLSVFPFLLFVYLSPFSASSSPLLTLHRRDTTTIPIVSSQPSWTERVNQRCQRTAERGVGDGTCQRRSQAPYVFAIEARHAEVRGGGERGGERREKKIFSLLGDVRGRQLNLTPGAREENVEAGEERSA